MTQLASGQDLALTATRLRLALGWDKERTAGFIGTGAPHVDLDASAVQFSGGQLFDLAFYNNLATRDGSVVHEGDHTTGAGDGDDEAIDVDLSKVYAKVDSIVLLVSSYQGHSLEWIDRAYVRVVDLDTDREVARFSLTGGVPQTGLVIAKLVRDPVEEGWHFRAIGEGIDATVPTSAIEKLAPYA